VHCVAVEHALSHVRVIRLAVLCAVEDKMDGICTFFFNSFPHVYDYFPCILWNGIIIFIINVLCAFAWTYMDLFIILISIALADRFRQLNRCMQSIKGKVSFFNKFSILYGWFLSLEIPHHARLPLRKKFLCHATLRTRLGPVCEQCCNTWSL
jgi:hypothetical protein